MNKKEAIDKIKNIGTLKINDTVLHQQFEMVDKNKALDIISQINESQKVVVPQYVADFYESIKDDFENKVYDLCVQFNFDKSELNDDVAEWFDYPKNKPIETLVKMKLFGYEIEKEKLYIVEIPNPNEPDSGHIVLSKDVHNKVYIDRHYEDDWKLLKSLKLTESEIKEDFEWAWRFAKEVEDDTKI